MTFISRLRLRTKLAVLLMLAALAVVATITTTAFVMHACIQQERMGKVRGVVQMALGPAEMLEF